MKTLLSRHFILICYLILLSVYVLAMVVYPVFKVYRPEISLREWNLTALSEFWNKWQSLNGGILGGLFTLLASIVAFYMVRKHEENKEKISRQSEQRKKQKISQFNRAALIVTSSEFFAYCNESASILKDAQRKVSTVASNLKGSKSDNLENFTNYSLPALPDYKETFRSFIEMDEEEINKYLALFVEKLQIFNSRLKSILQQTAITSFAQVPEIILIHNIGSYAVNLAEIYAMTGKLMLYARTKSSPLNPNLDRDLKLSIDDFTNAYSMLDFDDLYDDSNGFMKRVTERLIEKEWAISN